MKHAYAIWIWIPVALWLLVFAVFDAKACDLEPHPFARIGAGWSGDLDNRNDFNNNSDELAAQFELGYRWPMGENHALDFKLTHHSFWFDGFPFNEDDEITSDHINIGYEFRW